MKRKIIFEIRITLLGKYKIICPICTLWLDKKQHVYVKKEVLISELRKEQCTENDIEAILQDYEQKEGVCIFSSDDYTSLYQY